MPFHLFTSLDTFLPREPFIKTIAGKGVHSLKRFPSMSKSMPSSFAISLFKSTPFNNTIQRNWLPPFSWHPESLFSSNLVGGQNWFVSRGMKNAKLPSRLTMYGTTIPNNSLDTETDQHHPRVLPKAFHRLLPTCRHHLGLTHLYGIDHVFSYERNSVYTYIHSFCCSRLLSLGLNLVER